MDILTPYLAANSVKRGVLDIPPLRSTSTAYQGRLYLAETQPDTGFFFAIQLDTIGCFTAARMVYYSVFHLHDLP